MSPFLPLLLVAFARAQYVIDATEGCADIAVTVPGPFSILRIDQTDYEFDGESYCTKSWDPNDSIECSLTEQEDGTYLATARVCDVEDHVWAGFRMDEYMQNSRYAFVTVYFSQGDQYTNIENNCIQPQLSSPAVIDAVGQSEVQIICARRDECPQGPFSTIMTATSDLCRDYSAPACKSEMDGDIRKLKTTFKRPKGANTSFVFCSTLDSFLSYLINWA
ncbi:unnamed protein product [Hymenolepis diminuta]|uniref:DUF5727 domain-containing protein n=1 Tax=Hymenolepis diminuta TaxID=6216 RepID=A0A564YVS2_HYMDI|nr:unnamed protein product [Hymenolepis diminuta]